MRWRFRHDPRKAPLASDVKTVENAKRIQPGDLAANAPVADNAVTDHGEGPRYGELGCRAAIPDGGGGSRTAGARDSATGSNTTVTVRVTASVHSSGAIQSAATASPL